METVDWIQSGVLFVTILALWWQVSQSNKMAKLVNFRSYTERYQSIVMNLPIGIESDEFDLKAVDSEKREEILRWIRAYFDLCSEEYYLNSNGYIDKKVWTLWSGGMKDSFKKPAFTEAWKTIQRGDYYGSEFSDFVDFRLGR